MDKPLVSVLMTVYNREKYLAEAINSVLASTYTNFELIILDDASTDNSYEIALKKASDDSRIRLFRNENNLGDYPNRNKAASFAKGKYIKYLDADDIIYPHGLEVMVTAMEKFPDAALGTQLVIREADKPYPFRLSSSEVYQKHFLGGGLLMSGPTGTIIKRSVFGSVGGFRNERNISDIELWYRLSAIAPVVCFQPSLIWWRNHDEQEYKNEVYNCSIQKTRYEMTLMTLHGDIPLSPFDAGFAIFLQKRIIARRILKSILVGQFGFALDLWKCRHFRKSDILVAFRFRSNFKNS